MHLVTGASGMLGSHLAEQLRRRDLPVRCLIRPSTLERGNVYTRFLEQIGCELVPGELSDQASLTQAAKGCEVVFHSAAKVGDWGPWSEFVEFTVNGTRRVIEACKQAGVRRLLHISSISTYGHRNGEGQVFDETTSLGYGLYRWAYYSRSKVMADRILLEEYQKNGFPVTIVRPSWIYGDRDRATVGRMVRALRAGKAKVIGDGNNRLNLCYAGNIADGAVLAALDPDSVGESYNFADDGHITLSEYWAKVAEYSGTRPPSRHVPYWLAYRAGFVMECAGRLLRSSKPPLATRYSCWLMGRRCFFTSEKARTRLGWKSTVSYDEGIRRAVSWWLENADQPD